MPQGNFAEYTPQEQIAAARSLLQSKGLRMTTENLNRAMDALYRGTDLDTSQVQAAVDRSIARTERSLPLPPPSPPEQPQAEAVQPQAQPQSPPSAEASVGGGAVIEPTEEEGRVSRFFRDLYQQQAPTSWMDLLPMLGAVPASRAAGAGINAAVQFAPRMLPGAAAGASGRLAGPAATGALPAPVPQLPGPAGAAATAAPDANFMQRFMRLFTSEQPASASMPLGGRSGVTASPAMRDRAGRLYGDRATQPDPRQPDRTRAQRRQRAEQE